MPRRRRLRDLTPNTDVRAALGPVIHWLSQPLAYRAAVIAGVLLTVPAIFSGLAAEDVLLRLAALGWNAGNEPRSAWDLFRYVDNAATDASYITERLGLWSTAPDLEVRLFRPLSSLTHALDHVLWPQQVWLMHVHNVLWYALLVTLAGALYRNFLGTSWIAATATILFAVDDLHGSAVGGIANRHALIATSLACITIAVHDRHRRDGWSPGRWAGPLFFALALTAGSHGLAALGYLAAYAWIFDGGAPRDRALSLVPYLLVAIAVELLARNLGFGVVGWPGVVDPWAAPVASFGAVLVHVPVRAAALLGIPVAELHGVLPAWAAAFQVLLAAAATIAALQILRPLLENHRVARFFTAGALLGLFANSLSVPQDSLLLLPSLGFMGLLAQFFAAVVQSARAGRLASLRLPVVTLFCIWAVLHAIVAPVLLPVRAAASLPQAKSLAAANASLPSDAPLAEQQLVIVNAPDLLRSAFVLAHRATGSGVMPASSRILAVHAADVRVAREADDTIVMSLTRGIARLASAPWPFTGTATSAPLLQPGDRIDVGGFSAVVEAVDEAGATRIRFRFDVPCDNESLRWVAWDGTRYRPVAPPPIGEEMLLP